jgi:hypothetical protein
MSAYGNSLPYSSPELERGNLIGRIRVARFVADVHAKSGYDRTAKRYYAIVDELLDHLSELDYRVESARLGETCA